MTFYNILSVVLALSYLLRSTSQAIDDSDRSCCLFAPFITAASVTGTPVSPNNGSDARNLTFNIILDYRHKFQIKNVIVNLKASNTSFDTSASRIVYVQNVEPEYTYNLEAPRVPSIHPELVFSKFILFNIAKPIINGLTTDYTALEIAHPCSGLYVKEADYRFPVNPFRNAETVVAYRDFYRCSWITETAPNQGPMRASQDKLHLSHLRGITSASLYENLLFEFSANGELLVNFFDQSALPTMDKPLGNNFNYLNTVKRTRTNLMDFFFHNKFCSDVINGLSAKLSATTMEDLSRSKPYRTFTKLADAYLGFEKVNNFFGDKLESIVEWKKESSTSKSYSSKVITTYPEWFYQPDEYMLWAISFTDDPNPLGWAVYLRRTVKNKHLQDLDIVYVGNIRPDKNFSGDVISRHRERFVAPDDITHWNSCKMMVVLYGFAYNLIPAKQDILLTPTKWHLLQESYVDVPIEAMHAEGDEFWMFTRASSIQLMKADSSVCSKLVFTSKREIHLRQLFNPGISQLLLEHRYFDGYKWVPGWDEVPTEIENNDLWYFIIGGLAITGVFLVIIMAYFLRKTEKLKGDTIYSRSKNSHSEFDESKVLPSRDGSSYKQNQVSAMPLFSNHESLGSRESVPGAARSASPKKRASSRQSPKRSPTSRSHSSPRRASGNRKKASSPSK